MKPKTILITVLLLPQFLFAQHQLTQAQKEDKLVAGKIWQPFALTNAYPAFQKETFNFSSHQKPIFLYVGQRSCIICSYEFLTYAKMAKEFQNINFVYLTPDDSLNIVKKFGANLKIPNLFVIPVPIDTLWNKGVAKVFPVKYFISRSGIVVDASTGGTLKDRPALEKRWEIKLNRLEKED